MKIVIQEEKTIELDNITILAVRDVFVEKKIVARVEGLPRAVILWSGSEYDLYEAKNWTNDSALNKLKEKLQLNPVPFDV